MIDLWFLVPRTFNFEYAVDGYEFHALFSPHVYKITFTVVVTYLLSIPILQNYMKDRKPYNLQKPLIIWNAFLSIFSTFGAIRCFTPMFQMFASSNGVLKTLCVNDYMHTKPEAFWGIAFMLSKLPELLDTYFLIFRKKKVIFLHWYHHATVLTFCWLNYPYWNAGVVYYGAVNFFVHSLMYGYYSIASTRKFKIPKFISIFITSLQILQMVMGMWVHYRHFWLLLGKDGDKEKLEALTSDASSAKISMSEVEFEKLTLQANCHVTWDMWLLGVTIYSSYFVLFVKFFVGAYLTTGKVKGE